MHQAHADQEKLHAAQSSVLAAILLTGTKLLIGFITGSLGILAEALHSALDMAAAIITVLAVRISGRPADEEHLYGHGKVENLSALAETLLLLATCGWIVYEAIERLFFKPVSVEVSFWAFFVMALSIVVDYSRSRMLYRVARKYNSQALEADALHFSTDIWSSSVVLFGLLGVLLSEKFPAVQFLKHADAVAALVVALIVIYVSAELGSRTINALLDNAPKGLATRIKKAVETLPGISNCHNIRVRSSGSQVFVDVHILVDGSQSLESAHALTEQVESVVSDLAPGADVTVHPEPSSQKN